MPIHADIPFLQDITFYACHVGTRRVVQGYQEAIGLNGGQEAKLAAVQTHLEQYGICIDVHGNIL